MNEGKNMLSLLGLALRGGRLAIGDEAAAQSAQSGTARLLLTASDAGEKALRRARFLAEEGHCLLLATPFPKTELGGALGRGTAAIVAVTDLGLAAAITEKLALLDPEGCGDAVERMQLKLRRAKERKEAPRKRPPPEERSGFSKEEKPERSARRESGSWKPKGGKPGERKSDGWKPKDSKPGGRRSDGWKPKGGKPGERKSDGWKPKGSKPGERKSDGWKPKGGKPGERKSDGWKPKGGKPSERRSDGWKPRGGKPSERKSDGWKPKGGKPGARKSGGWKPKGTGHGPKRSGPKGHISGGGR